MLYPKILVKVQTVLNVYSTKKLRDEKMNYPSQTGRVDLEDERHISLIQAASQSTLWSKV